MLNQVEITPEIQNIFDLWTSIGETESTLDQLPIISDAYRDAGMDWEADFCQWLVTNKRKPSFTGSIWGFLVNNEIKVEYLMPNQAIARELRRQKGEKIVEKLPPHYLPHQFLSLGCSLVGEIPPKCYYLAIVAFGELSQWFRQQVLDTDCLGS